MAFERLYRRYVRDVYRYSLAVLRNPADAEDITQTTFLNAYRAYLRGEEPDRPRNWLIKIAHNACRSRHLRAVRRPHEVPLEETIAAVPVAPYEAPKVEELLAALGRLPFNQRAAIVMRELEGRSYAEISDTLEVSVAAVETLIFRARRTLRRDRSLLGVLGSVQVPPSLTSFCAGGAGAVAGGGAAAAGSGALFKVLLTVTAGVVAATVGTGVDTVLGGNKAPRPAVVQPDVFAAPAGAPATAPTSSTGLRGPIVIANDGRAIVFAGGSFGAAPGARLAGGLYVVRGALSGTAVRPGTAPKQPVGEGGESGSSGAAPAPVAVTAVPSASPSGTLSTTTAAATTSVSDTTSSAGVPDVSTPTVSTPSVPVLPPPPVAVPSLPVAPPPPPPLPSLPDPPKLP